MTRKPKRKLIGLSLEVERKQCILLDFYYDRTERIVPCFSIVNICTCIVQASFVDERSCLSEALLSYCKEVTIGKSSGQKCSRHCRNVTSLCIHMQPSCRLCGGLKEQCSGAEWMQSWQSFSFLLGEKKTSVAGVVLLCEQQHAPLTRKNQNVCE